jgi:hypothetical protein
MRLGTLLRPGAAEAARLRDKLAKTRRTLAKEKERSNQRKADAKTWKKESETWKKESETWKKESETWKKESKRLHTHLSMGARTPGPSSRPASVPDDGSVYLDLMKRTVSGWVYADDNIQGKSPSNFDPATRERGGDWPDKAQTMIGLKRLDNLQACVEDTLANDVPGDLIETGVWRGGATILMRAILRAHQVSDRRVWVADSFQGLPPPQPEEYPYDKGSSLHTFQELAILLAEVQGNFERYGLLDEQVCFLEGWFRDTLPLAPIDRLAVARLDGDMYESTMDALVHLYPKLSVGGYLIVDDYGAFRSCREAVHDYREAYGIEDEIHRVDWIGAFWQRSG